MRAGFGPHGIAVIEMILACGGRRHLCGWQVEVNHAIKAIGLSFSSDAVLTLPTATSEVRLFEVDNGTMTRARLAKGDWDYERYAGHRAWEGARGTVGRTYDFWARHRYTRSRLFPTLHVVLTGLPEHLLQGRLEALARGVEGITIAVLVTTLPRLKRGEPWYELAVDDDHRRLARYAQVFSR
ncbi:replication-relaxation family protein [Streptomyces rimosus]|uniref:replication-relaxation family protein n=1 Tax=Streptomyces rimosus TaxID=1927 RepID=UPI0037D7514C